jgi:hypothetical protein
MNNHEFVLVFLSCPSYVRLVSIIPGFPYPYAYRTYLLFSYVLLHMIPMATMQQCPRCMNPPLKSNPQNADKCTGRY